MQRTLLRSFFWFGSVTNVTSNEKSKVFLHCEMQTVGMIRDEAEEILL